MRETTVGEWNYDLLLTSLMSLSIFVTPRVNNLLVKEKLYVVMTKCYVYVDVPRILRNCQCMYDVIYCWCARKKLESNFDRDTT